MGEFYPDWIVAARDAVEKGSESRQTENTSLALGETIEALDTLLPQLERVAQAAAQGSTTWWDGFEASSDLKETLRATDLSTDLRQLQSAVRVLKNFEKSARERVRAAWGEYVTEATGNVQELRGLAQALSGVPGQHERVKDFVGRLSGIDRLRTALPDADAKRIVDEIAAKRRDLEQQLPMNVRNFVTSAAGTGASLEMLDAEVRAWLVANEVAENFAVVTRSAGGARG